MQKSLDQFAVFFSIIGIFGAGALALIGFNNAAEIDAPSWPYFVGAVVVAFQCSWLYTLSRSLAELLRRTAPPAP